MIFKFQSFAVFLFFLFEYNNKNLHQLIIHDFWKGLEDEALCGSDVKIVDLFVD